MLGQTNTHFQITFLLLSLHAFLVSIVYDSIEILVYGCYSRWATARDRVDQTRQGSTKITASRKNVLKIL